MKKFKKQFTKIIESKFKPGSIVHMILVGWIIPFSDNDEYMGFETGAIKGIAFYIISLIVLFIYHFTTK